LEQDWVEAFSSKQFRQNTEAMIKRYIKEGNRASAEASDLGRGVGGGGGGGYGGDDFIDDDEEEPEVDEKRIILPFKILYHGEIGTGTNAATLIVIVSGGQYYAKIVRNKVIIELVTKSTLYDPAAWLALLPQLDSLAGGPFLQTLEKEGKSFKENPDDFEYPDRIRHFAEYDMEFDIEQNFMPVGRMPAWAEFPHADGSKTLMFNVVALRDNQHTTNASNKQYFSQPPQQPFAYPMPQSQPHQQHHYYSQQQQPLFGGGGGPPTPQHNNTSGWQQQQQQYTSPQQQYASPQQQYASPQQQPLAAQYVTPPAQQQQHLQPQPSFPFGPQAAAAQYVSPQVQQYMSPPVQQQQQQQYQRPVTQYKTPPKAPPPVQVHRRVQLQDPNTPTPGVPKAAGLKNMSVDSEYTEETVEEEANPKTPSFFRRVASTLTGQSSDGSSVSAHMKPPPKKTYYVETVTSETETETSTSL